MHELSIAEELVRAIREELRSHPNARLKSALVRVGVLRLIRTGDARTLFRSCHVGLAIGGCATARRTGRGVGAVSEM